MSRLADNEKCANNGSIEIIMAFGKATGTRGNKCGEESDLTKSRLLFRFYTSNIFTPNKT